MARIVIDASEERVTLSSKATSRSLDGQWVVFYLTLALRRTAPGDSGAYLDAEELKVLGQWSLGSSGIMVGTR